MKKSLLALAVLGAFAGTAAAQSSVTLFGIVDLNGRQIKNGTVKQFQQVSNSLNSNRLGFRGTEDLGGGMSAGFWLEGGMDNSDGVSAKLDFQRRSTVSLMGRFGEVRLGRDYTPSFWNTTIFDPFGTNGVGSFLNVVNTSLGSGATTYVRANNSFGYFLPGNLGGLYGQVQRSLAESLSGANDQTSARIGFAAGPVNVAVSFGTTDTTPNKFKHNNVALSWNFGFMNLMGQYDMTKAGSVDQKAAEIGVVVPVGQGEIKAAYTASKIDNPAPAADPDAKQVAVGYIYNLSKRTALYGHYAQITNKNGATFQVGSINGSTGTAANTKSSGFEVGLRHAF